MGGTRFLLQSLRPGYLDQRLTQITSQPWVSPGCPGRKACAGEGADSLLTPIALLVYRVFRNEAKRTTKILHGLLHGFAFIIALVGEFLGTALPPCLPGVPGIGCRDGSPEVPASQVSPGSPGPLPSPTGPPSRHACLRPGLVAVFDYHRKKGYADLYSLHSWCGILAFVLYVVQVSPSRPTAGGEQRAGPAEEWGARS